MGLCNSLPSLQCGCFRKCCCHCCACRCCALHRPVDKDEGTSPLRYVFHWSSLPSVGSADPDGRRRNLPVHSKGWNSPECQTNVFEVSPLLANDAGRVRIVQCQPLSSAKIVYPPTPERLQNNAGHASVHDSSLIAERGNGLTPRTQLDFVRSGLNRHRMTQMNATNPGLSDFWNELSHTLHFLRFPTPVMCEVSYTANCAPAARLFIPIPIKNPFVPSLMLTPPPSPSLSLHSTSCSIRSPFAVRSSHNFIRVSSLKERSGT